MSAQLNLFKEENTDCSSRLFRRRPFVYHHEGLGYRSKTEIRIAEVLDEMGIFYLPNCLCRLTRDGKRCTLEADFLIVYVGRVGILEVDGEPFHPPERSAIEHRRDRAFKRSGICVVERFDASECYRSPVAVVEEFLEILGGEVF